MGILRKLAAGLSLALLVAVLLPLSAVAASPRELDPSTTDHTDRVVIRWAREVMAAGRRPDLVALPGTAVKNARFLRETGSGASVYKLDAPMGKNKPQVLDRLRRMPGVISAEADGWRTPTVLPNDQYASQLWGLLGPGDGSTWGIDAQTAWAAVTDPTKTQGKGAVVAVVDTGLVYSHPDLTNQALPGYDMVSDTSISHDGNARDSDASDPGDWCGAEPSSWHGTHVAGTIAALANNTIGVFGGAPGAKILPVRVLGACGGYDSDISDGIRWAAGGSVPNVPANPTPAKVINLSLGGPDLCPSLFLSAIGDARSRGAVVVAAAGNSTADAAGFTPANCPGVVSVAAIDSTGDRANFSNYGASVKIAAPGDVIWSTVNLGTTTPAANGYANYRGTSMATPHVSLSAALIAAAHPTFTPDQIETVLYATAKPFPVHTTPLACDQAGCGAGIVNAGNALSRLQSGYPVVGPVTASADYPTPGASITVRASVVGVAAVSSAEMQVDGGSWVAMSALDGSFGGGFETATWTGAAPSAEGWHTVCVRATAGGLRSDGTQCGTIGVDAAPPVVGAPVLTPGTAETGTPVAAAATATDGLAVVKGEVRVDSGTWWPAAAADSAFGDSTESVRLAVGLKATSLSTSYHTCAVTSGGSLWCWGANDHGEIGDGTDTFRGVPVQVPLANVASVSTGLWTTCARLTDSTVRCWGYDYYGQLGDGGSGAGADEPSPVNPGLTGVVSVAAGPYHTCAVLSDTTVRCWGRNDRGQLGDGTTTGRPTPTAVSDGAGGTLSGVVSVAVGTYHTCAILNTGAARCWGRNDRGQLGNGTTTEWHVPVPVSGLSGATQIDAGQFTCALVAGGNVRCWGPNDSGQLGDDTSTDRFAPVAPYAFSGGATQITLGLDHACVRVGSGAAYCWGYNGEGQLGFGNYYDQYFPKAVSALNGVTAIGAGADMTCAITAAGVVSCAGYNLYGNLGSGGYGDKPTPTPVAGFGALPGGQHTICVRASDPAGHTSAGTCASVTVTGPPSAPGNVTATRGDTTATVAWSASTAFGHPVTGYVATSNPGGRTCTTTGLSCQVTGLTNGTSYTFTVVATSDAGNSVPSAASVAVVPAGLPGAPGSVTGRRGDTQATISWSAAAANGAAITSYRVLASDGVHSCTTSALSCTVTGLTNGVSYTFTVRATNAVGTGPASAASAPVIPAVIIVRYSGPDRFATAADVALKTFGSSCGCVVYISNYTKFADALAGAAAASKVSGPVLLVTPTGAINSYTDQALKALHPTKIIVLGGTASIPQGIYDLLSHYAPSITRYSGIDRFAMAKETAIRTFGASCACTVYISNSNAFTDALAGAAAASKNKGPILLVTATGAINTYTDQALKTLLPARIVVLGGTASVSQTVYDALAHYAPSITRYSGVDRFQSAANTSVGTFGANCGCVVYVANATTVPDALAGAAAASKVSGPILLVAATGPINQYTAQALRTLNPREIIVLGGTTSISPAVYDLLKGYAAP